MQIRADIGEGAPGDARLDEHREDDEPCPRIREEGAVTGPESRRGFGRVADRTGARVDDKLEDEPSSREREHGREHEEHVAPAEQVAEHAAGRLAEELAGNLSREIAPQDRLATLVGRHVSDIGHRERNDPSGRRTRSEARNGEGRQRLHRAAQRHQDRGERAHHRDRAILAEPVSDRSDDELDRAVAHGIGSDDDRGRSHRGPEIGGDLRQERVGDPHHRLAREPRARQQDYGARRHALG
jgi:hypothetical protein